MDADLEFFLQIPVNNIHSSCEIAHVFIVYSIANRHAQILVQWMIAGRW